MQDLASCVCPGQHILTCGHCHRSGIYPISQIIVTHLRAPGSATHPGEITRRINVQFKEETIARLTPKLRPGEHILTCSHCGQMGIFPISQIIVDHLVAPGCLPHPGEIRR